jgi:hypothetical protein
MKTIFVLLALAAITDSAIAATPPQNADAAKPAASLPAGHMPAKAVPSGDIKVPKASGPDARTVAEVVAKRIELKNKTVVIRGKVVKFNAGIMKMNWVHLRDGSGSEADNTNDLLVTTQEVTQVGDVVVVKGVVHIDKDFGMGYSYKVLVEEAKLQK